MKIPSACNVVVVASAVVGVSGFSTTTQKPGIWTNIGKSYGVQTQLFSTEDGIAEAVDSEEMTRRKMLAARLQSQKAAVVSSEDDDTEIGGTDAAEEAAEDDNKSDDESPAPEPAAYFAETTDTEDDTVEIEVVADVVKDDEEASTPPESSVAYFVSKDDTKEEEESDTEDASAAPVTADVYFAAASEEVTTPPAPAPKPAPSTANTNTNKDDGGIKLDIAAKVAANIAKDVAVDLLSLIRFGAANLLTQSLPENQRQDLLRRMGAQMLPPAGAKDDEKVKEEEIAAKVAAELDGQRASIQEEIALARAEEAQKNEKQWEREKEDIMKQMEEAANARIKDELEVQQMRLEQEQAKAIKEKEAELEAERNRIAAIEEERVKEREAMEKEKEALARDAESAAEDVVEVSDLFVGKTEEEEEQNRQLEELLEKRKKQQMALESIEEELRTSVANEAEERERLNSLLEKRKEQQSELSIVEENLRAQVAEIEAEKAQVKQLLSELEEMKEQERELQEKKQAEPESSDVSDENKVEEDGEDEPENPVLGRVVADLGYKRIHFVSAAKLGNIPVWNKNRTYRNSRAKAMAGEKEKSIELGFPGSICLHEDANGKLSIVDGQHRVGMMAALRTAFNKKKDKGEDLGGLKDIDTIFDKIIVEVYPEPVQVGSDDTEAGNDKFAEKVFVEINKAEPVKLIDMPGVASAADRKIITEAMEDLSANYPSMFSPSQRCRVPNVNIDNLRSAVFGANILKRHKLTTSKKLLDWLLEQNAALGEEYESSKEKQSLISNKQWAKASTNNFYLGLESSWLYK